MAHVMSIILGDNQGFGLHIAEGYAQTSKGLEVGVFVKDIVPGSPADKSGRYSHYFIPIDFILFINVI